MWSYLKCYTLIDMQNRVKTKVVLDQISHAIKKTTTEILAMKSECHRAIFCRMRPIIGRCCFLRISTKWMCTFLAGKKCLSLEFCFGFSELPYRSITIRMIANTSVCVCACVNANCMKDCKQPTQTIDSIVLMTEIVVRNSMFHWTGYNNA